MQKLKSLSDRLNHALDLLGTRKVDLARAIDVKPQVIQFLCSSNTQSSRFTFEIAMALGLNSRWLATGEGEMFVADDPKYKIVNEFQRIPVIPSEKLITFLRDNHIEDESISTWIAISYHDQNIFAFKIQDASMEPFLPLNSILLIEKIPESYSPRQNDIVLVFSKKYASIMVRKITSEKNKIVLHPCNVELFKAIEFTSDQVILGLIRECHFKINGS